MTIADIEQHFNSGSAIWHIQLMVYVSMYDSPPLQREWIVKFIETSRFIEGFWEEVRCEGYLARYFFWYGDDFGGEKGYGVCGLVYDGEEVVAVTSRLTDVRSMDEKLACYLSYKLKECELPEIPTQSRS